MLFSWKVPQYIIPLYDVVYITHVLVVSNILFATPISFQDKNSQSFGENSS